MFSQIHQQQRRAKENLPPLLDVGGNVVKKDEILNTFFLSVFNNKIHCSPGTLSLKLDDRNRSTAGAEMNPP